MARYVYMYVYKDIDLYENEDWSYQSLLNIGTYLKF